MQVKIDAKELHEALKVFAVVIPKSSHPALTYLKLEAAKDRLILSGTDLETNLKCELPAETTNQTAQAVCLPFHKFKQYVSKKKGRIRITLDPKEVIVGDAIFSDLLDVENFPEFPTLPEDLPLSFEAEELAEALSFCLPCVAEEESRFVLSGVYFDLPCQNEPPLAIDHAVARLVASDGHRLAMVETDFKGSIEGKLEAIVPKVGLTALLKVLKRTDGLVSLNFSDDLYVRTDTWEIGIKLIEGQYPDYRAVFPKKGLRAIFDVPEMLEALKELETLRTGRYAAVKCTFEDDIELMLKQENSSSSKTVTSQYRGPRVSLHFNVRYLIDALKGRSGKVIFSFGNSCTPAVLQFGNDPRKVALVMPIKPDDDKTERSEIPEEALSPLPTLQDLEQYRVETRVETKVRKRGRKAGGCATCKKLKEKVQKLQKENELLREQVDFLKAELQKTHLEAEGEAVNAVALVQEVEELKKRIAELEREHPMIPLQRLPEGGAMASVDGVVLVFRGGRILRPNGNGGELIGRYDRLLGLGKIGDRVVHLTKNGNGWILEVLK